MKIVAVKIPGAEVGVARWSPTTYLEFADQRSRPFVDLLTPVSVEDVTSIVDLGCGPGHLSAVLRARWPDAEIVGIDSSPDMIARAQGSNTDRRVAYQCADAATWTPDRPVDLLVSNAALQWLPGHRQLLARWLSFVRPGGVFAFQVPGNFDEPSHTLLHACADIPPYAEHTAGRERPSAADATTYLDDLSRLGATVDAWETTYLQVLPGDDPVFEWMKGTGGRPVLQALPDELRETFVREYKRDLRAAYPRQPYGTVLPFRRVFVVARVSS
jgi:trans-aconitate 2-methyltransferase